MLGLWNWYTETEEGISFTVRQKKRKRAFLYSTCPSLSYNWLFHLPSNWWIIRPFMGIAVCMNRWAIEPSIACMADIPRWDIARLIERCWLAALAEERRGSKAGDQTDLPIKDKSQSAPGRASYNETSQPLLASISAARQPTGPAPTTTARRLLAGIACGVMDVCLENQTKMQESHDKTWPLSKFGKSYFPIASLPVSSPWWIRSALLNCCL